MCFIFFLQCFLIFKKFVKIAGAFSHEKYMNHFLLLKRKKIIHLGYNNHINLPHTLVILY